jgi:hypothetical protein
VAVGAEVGAAVGAAVGAEVGAAVGAEVGASVAVGDGVAVGVDVAVGLAVGWAEGVPVGVGNEPKMITSMGEFADSLLPKLTAVPLLPVTARLTRPWPVMSDVTFTLTVAPAATGPEVTEAAPKAGAFVAVVFVSLQVLTATA